MNLRQSYEQLIADKLRKLPAPDADASWQQMKRLLDENEDKGAGGKRTPGNGGGWWRIGIIAIILSASGWLYFDRSATHRDDIATNKTALSNNNQTATIDKNTTLPVKNSTNSNLADKTNEAASADVKAPGNINAQQGSDQNNIVTANANSNSATPVVNNSIAASSIKSPEKTIPGPDKFHDPVTAILPSKEKKKMNGSTAGKRTEEKEDAADKNSPTVLSPVDASANTIDGLAKINQLPAKQKYNNIFSTNTKPVSAGKGSFDAAGGSYVGVNQPVQRSSGTNWLEELSAIPAENSNIPSANTALLVGDSIENKRNTAGLLNSETKKAVVKAQRAKALEDMSRKDKKSLHLNLGNLFKPFSLRLDPEPRWAAGIAINNGITLNAQNRFNYNMNGKSGLLSDYIPSVYLQYHLNNVVFVQTELHFVNPQYTPQLLVYQQSNNVTAQAGVSEQKSVYIQKLYYFSVPVTFHYSPINNLYFSAGLQFSSFQSGLATIQQKQYNTLAGPDHPNDVSNTVLKFKDDSIAAKLSPNEWRWQAGAEYYWNRFTVGMRYNRSLKKLANIDVSSTLPNNSLRNESMILFLRYNLFESRKKQRNDK